MMPRRIGYYVHHHGAGHLQRALAIARAAGDGITLLGTGLAGQTGEIPCLDLPDDRLEHGTFDGLDHVGRPASLHYAPVDHEGIRRRVAALTGWIADCWPSLIVVDVSVEVAMLARLASVPTVYVRLSGNRADPPHQDAFRGATALLAPFHADLDDERTSEAVRGKTFYAPGIVKLPGRTNTSEPVALVIVGRGGGASDGSIWAEAASRVRHLKWRVLGPCSVPSAVPDNLEFRGWMDDPAPMIASATVVIGAAGDGVVGSVIAARRPFICLPEERPFEEQLSKARRVAALNAAIVCMHYPSPDAWPDLVERAIALSPDGLARLNVRDGARRAARWLRSLADDPHKTWSNAACL